jgi:hypothetical protein
VTKAVPIMLTSAAGPNSPRSPVQRDTSECHHRVDLGARRVGLSPPRGRWPLCTTTEGPEECTVTKGQVESRLRSDFVHTAQFGLARAVLTVPSFAGLGSYGTSMPRSFPASWHRPAAAQKVARKSQGRTGVGLCSEVSRGGHGHTYNPKVARSNPASATKSPCITGGHPRCGVAGYLA